MQLHILDSKFSRPTLLIKSRTQISKYKTSFGGTSMCKIAQKTTVSLLKTENVDLSNIDVFFCFGKCSQHDFQNNLNLHR